MNRRVFLRRGLIGAGVCALVPLGIACQAAPAPAGAPGSAGQAPAASGQAPAAAKGSKSLVFAWGLDPRTFDPAINNASVEQTIDLHVYDSLTALDPKGKVLPALAESWSNPDPKTWRFKLREGVKFHNGEPFNAEAVKFTIDRIFDPEVKSTSKDRFQVEKTSVVDQSTIDIQLKAPSPLFLKSVAAYLFIAEPKYMREKGIEAAGISPVGTGAFRFREWVKGVHITLDRNPDYWGGPPKYDSLTFKTLPQPASRVAALKAGEVDLVVDLDPTAAKDLQNSSEIKVLSVPSYRNIYVMVNHRVDSPVQKREVRQALNMAIDKDALVRDILEGHGTPLDGQPYTAMWSNGYNAAYQKIAYDPEKAKQTLAAAGYPNGFEIEFVTPQGRYVRDKEMTEAIAGQLEKVGVKAKISITEWANYMSRLQSKQAGALTFTGQGIVSLDPLEHFQSYWRSAGTVSQYNNPAFDELAAKAWTEMDDARRGQLVQQGITMLIEDAANLWLYQQHQIYGMRGKVKSWTPSNTEMFDFRGAEIA